jgi:hypothetical protein
MFSPLLETVVSGLAEQLESAPDGSIYSILAFVRYIFFGLVGQSTSIKLPRAFVVEVGSELGKIKVAMGTLSLLREYILTLESEAPQVRFFEGQDIFWGGKLEGESRGVEFASTFGPISSNIFEIFSSNLDTLNTYVLACARSLQDPSR